MAKSTKKTNWLARIIILLVIGAALGVSMLFELQINYALGLTKIEEKEYSGTKASDVLSVASDLNVHFVDVGQGDACIIELPDGKNMLIDGGDKDSEVAENLLSYIEANILDDDGTAIDYFDYAILTHPDADHCGSMDKVLQKYPAKVFYRPNVLATRSGYTDPGKNALIAGYGEKETIEYRDVIAAGYNAELNTTVLVNNIDLPAIVPEGIAKGEDGYYSFTFYGPESPSYTDWNDYSPIMILEYEDIRFALTGDCEKHGEAEFAENVEEAKTDGVTDKFDEFTDDFHVDVIKLGHHGSRTSTGEALVDAITGSTEQRATTLLIASCGFDNKYDHPHTDKITELVNAGFKEENVLRTDKNGTIVLSVRYDENQGKSALFYGANAMVKSQKETVDWRYIAIAIFTVAFLILIVYPIVGKRKMKKIVKGSKRSK